MKKIKKLTFGNEIYEIPQLLEEKPFNREEYRRFWSQEIVTEFFNDRSDEKDSKQKVNTIY